MRFVKCWIVAAGVSSAVASPGAAQNAASLPAGITRHRESSETLAPLDSGRTSLRSHMVRGGVIGALSGLMLSGLFLAWISHDAGQCLTVSSDPGFGGSGCGSGRTAAQVAKLLVGSVLVGAGAGAILGREYHITVEEERAARCRAHPDTTCS